MGQLLRFGHHTGIEGPIELATDAFLATSDFTDATRGVYRRTLLALADELEQGILVHEISRAELEHHLKQRYGDASPATFNRNLAAFRSFFDWCIEYGRTDKNPAAKIKARKKRRTTTAERQARPSGTTNSMHSGPTTNTIHETAATGRCSKTPPPEQTNSFSSISKT